MSWHLRLTRFGSVHLVKQQENVASCGIACILMINFKIKKGLMFAGVTAGQAVAAVPVPGAVYVGATMSLAAIQLAMKTEPEVYKIYGDLVGTAYDGNTATAMQLFPKVLKRLGLGNWECYWAGPRGIAKAIQAEAKAGAPCLVHVRWRNGEGHYVCIDDVFSPFGSPLACVNDPSTGEVVVTELIDGPITYPDANTNFFDSLFRSGTFSGWILRRVSAP
jgi:hypothetical protein